MFIQYSILGLLLFTAYARAQEFSTPVQINPVQSNSQQKAPQFAFAPDGRMYCGWIDYTQNPGGDLVISVSTDGGVSFSEPVGVRIGGSINTDFQRTLLLAASANGIVHVVWMESQFNNQPDIFYTRSTDGGSTFAMARSVSADENKWVQDFPSLAIDGGDGVYICFLDEREKSQGQSNNTQLYLTRSTDGGETFSDPVRTTFYPDGIGGTCECCATDIVASAEGHLYLVYRSNIENRRDIYVVRSMDGGVTFETPILAASEPWFIDSCPVTGPSADLDEAENLHIVWRDSRSSSAGKNYIYYTSLPYGENSCLPDQQISGTVNRSEYPDITAFPGGGLLCVFEDARNDAGDIFATYSLDGGASFAAARPINGSTVPGKQLFAACGVHPVTSARYVFWQDNAGGQSNIFMSIDSTRLIQTGGVEEPAAIPHYRLGACYPNPLRAGASATLPFEGMQDTRAEVGIYDALGRYVRRAQLDGSSVRIDSDGLVPGVYRIVLRSSAGIQTQIAVVR
jgi:hypothetical protein